MEGLGRITIRKHSDLSRVLFRIWVVMLMFVLLVFQTNIAFAANIPFSSTGSLGPLNVNGYNEIVFYTDSGLYAIDGVMQNDTSNRRAVKILPDTSEQADLTVYDFTSINIGPNTRVRVSGISPLVLLASQSAAIAGTVELDAGNGSSGGFNGAGGGAAGGGAITVFTSGSYDIIMSGNISANGGNGGEGNQYSGNGQGASGSAGGGNGGNGGLPTAGGRGGNGGSGALIGVETKWLNIGIRMGGGGGGGGGAFSGPGGNGAALVGSAGNAGGAGVPKQQVPGGAGGSGGALLSGGAGGAAGAAGGGNGANGGNGGGITFLTGAGGGGGGGGTPGGNGGMGGTGARLGGGGGGGGGGADSWRHAARGPGKGGAGGPGGGGGAAGAGGGDGVRHTQLGFGGSGGGGVVVLGSESGTVYVSGVVSVAGGSNADNNGGPGSFIIYGNYDLTGATYDSAMFYPSSAGVGPNEYYIVGGGAGAGGGGYGQFFDDEPSIGFLGMSFLLLSGFFLLGVSRRKQALGCMR